MMREIGSNFWLDPDETYSERQADPGMFRCLGDDYAWLSTGRSAIRFALLAAKAERQIRSNIALIPSFTCYTVAEPFLAEGFAVETIPVTESLCYDADEILTTALRTHAGVVLLHQYFGFQSLDNGTDLIRRLRETGVVVIEDRTQCLYSDTGFLKADYTVGSIRKWGGMPDGSFAVRTQGKFSFKPQKQDDNLEYAKSQAAYAKYRWLFRGEGEKESYLRLYRVAEDILDAQDGFYHAGRLSLAVQANLDLPLMCEKRRENFTVLLDGLCDCDIVKPVFNDLPEPVVPLYFPITVSNRAALQAFLRDHQIYAPIVWPKPETFGEVCRSAEYLYRHQLCIPVDQRYDTDDMLRIVDTIRSFAHG